MKICFLCLAIITLSSCANLTNTFSPSPFTTENVMKIHQGMSSSEILKTFGNPKNIRQAICGGDRPWNCTTWEYGDYSSDRASFTFSGATPDALILNNFHVDRK